MEEKKLRLSELFTSEQLQEIQDSFLDVTGLSFGVYDNTYQPLTEHHAPHQFCMKYIKSSHVAADKCYKCDVDAITVAADKFKPVVYKCYNGLIEVLIPVVHNEHILGVFWGGQVVEEPFTEEQLRNMAEAYVIDYDELSAEAKNIKVMSMERVEKYSNMLFKYVNLLAETAIKNYSAADSLEDSEQENNMKSDFLANMSHEIRTPMNAVVGMAEMALREDLPPMAREYINQIKGAGNTLLTIINDILDFSKIESGKMNITLEQYSPIELVNEIKDLIVVRIGNKNIDFYIDYDPDIPEEIMGDKVRIKQIILNLLNNAVKFTSSGYVKLTVSSEKRREGEIILKCIIEDTGIGIKMEEQNKLFQSFSQVNAKRNRNVEGTGLGLAISKQLVSLMNGTIGMESTYGKGSKFFFEVPHIVIGDQKPSVYLKPGHDPFYAAMCRKEDVAEVYRSVSSKLGVEVEFVKNVSDIEDFISRGGKLVALQEHMLDDSLVECMYKHPDVHFAIMIGFGSSLNIDSPNVLTYVSPMYAYHLAAILNHEESMLHKFVESEDSYTFIAPNAEVLIVDDNALNLTVAAGLMKPTNMKIETAFSGREAVELAKNHYYDIIFMDHMMPEMDGIQATKLIRNQEGLSTNVPIIALTANAMEETQSLFYTEGMNDFIAKPIDTRVLLEKIKQWLPADKIEEISAEEREIRQMQMEIHREQTEDPKLRALRATGSLDIDYALELLGDSDLFWQVLKDYYKVIPKKLTLFKNYYTAKDWDNYTIEAHALKSASKQIGAIQLSKVAEAIETAGHQKDYPTIFENHNEMIRVYTKIGTMLKDYIDLSEDEFESMGPMDLKTLSDVMINLREAANNLDMDAVEEITKMLLSYEHEAEIALEVEQIKDAVEDFDVDTIIFMVDSIEHSIRIRGYNDSVYA